MPTQLTTRERFQRMYSHREADRVPILDYPWGTTIERWQREGMPKGVSFEDHFDLDKTAWVPIDLSPRFENKVVEETAEYVIFTTPWGVTARNWKHASSTPEFIDFTIKDRESWAPAKARMAPSPDRVNWDELAANFRKWREEGRWIQTGLWFGFDATHSWVVGTERLLMALVEDPQWCVDVFTTQLNLNLAMLDMLWDRGITFDGIQWCDDLGYKLNQFMSVKMYRELLKPFHKRAIEWAHSKGIVASLHSCGDIRPFIPEWVEIGLDCLNPLEVKAGVDPFVVKKTYGKDLVLHGGINAVLWTDIPAMRQAVQSALPVLKESGGYIFSTDHSIPDSVSLKDFTEIIQMAKELGKY
jgi:uroporphyrinogen decarboxylase